MAMSRVRRRTFSLVAFLFVGAACGGDDPAEPAGPTGPVGGGQTPTITTNVSVSNNVFSPPLIQVSPGATVTWTWAAGSVPHNVTFSNSSITNIPNQTTGAHSTTMPTTPGDYTYECTNHTGMAGTVRVQ